MLTWLGKIGSGGPWLAGGVRMRNDPWTAAGIALLMLLSAGVVQLYRSAPQSAAQARTGMMVAAMPNRFEPRLARAEERLRAAEATPAGDDSVAIVAFREAAVEAARATEAASDDAERTRAREVWATAVLGWADRVRVLGTGRGIRPDDDSLLQQALRLADQVIASRAGPPARQRAQALRETIRRQLRVGPLEWLPAPR